MNAYDIIIKPVMSEKAFDGISQTPKRYTFIVAKNANKVQIKQAIEQIFDVKVAKVNTMHVTGKIKRMGRFQGRRASWKKAIVTLREGEVINLFAE